MSLRRGKSRNAAIFDEFIDACAFQIAPVSYTHLAALVTMKIPEHPYSVIKMLKDAYKAELDENKVINLMECNKIDNVPKLMKFSRMSYGENLSLIHI